MVDGSVDGGVVAWGSTTPEIESSGIFWSPIVTTGTGPAYETELARPVWLTPSLSR